MTRTGYPSDEEWAFAAPYLTLKKKDARSRAMISARCSTGCAGLSAPVRSGACCRTIFRLGQLLALHVTPADEQERDQIGKLAEEVQAVTKQSVKVCYADQGDTAQAAKNAGIELIVIKLPEAKKGFALLPKRWVVECSFAWAARFRRLARDFERTPEILRGLHFVAFFILMLHNLVRKILESS